MNAEFRGTRCYVARDVNRKGRLFRLCSSSLTILGVVIGVAAVITMVNIGSGATVQVTQQIESLGTNLLIVTPGQRMGMGQRAPASAFEVDDAEAIAREVPAVAGVAPSSSQVVTTVFGNENWRTSIVGTDNQFPRGGQLDARSRPGVH